MTFFQKIILGFLVVAIMCVINFWQYDRSIAWYYIYACGGLVLTFVISMMVKRN